MERANRGVNEAKTISVLPGLVTCSECFILDKKLYSIVYISSNNIFSVTGIQSRTSRQLTNVLRQCTITDINPYQTFSRISLERHFYVGKSILTALNSMRYKIYHITFFDNLVCTYDSAGTTETAKKNVQI